MVGGSARRVYLLSLVAMLPLSLLGPTAQAATKIDAGSSCKKEGTTREIKVSKKKSQRFVCVVAIDGNVWWPEPGYLSRSGGARKALLAWNRLSQPAAIADLAVLEITTSESVQGDLVNAVTSRDEWAAKAHEAQVRQANLSAERDALPSQLSAASSATVRAKEAHEEAVAVAERELATLNAMYPEYSSALDAQYGGLGPGIACEFGFTEYCADAAAYAALRPWANAVVARYEAQAAVADAAVAAMGALYRDWEARYAEWEALSNRNGSIGADLQQAQADVGHATNMLATATSEANRINERVALLPRIQSMYSGYLAAQDQYRSLLAKPQIQKGTVQKRAERLRNSGLGLEASHNLLFDLWSRYVD
jgi:hypothetical protein